MRVAVIGHVEWVEFALVERVPAAGEIVHAAETWEEPGGAGAVAAVQLAKLAGGSAMFTALGDDDLGRRAQRELEAHRVRVHAAFRPVPQRRVFAFIDSAGERTLTTIGERLGSSRAEPLPWYELAGMDAVYFTAGDRSALEAGRTARVLTATTRVMAALAEAHVALDAVIGSAGDEGERYEPGLLDPPPQLVVLTDGANGGTYQTADSRSGSFPATPLPGPRVDSYGCGDSFAAGLTYGLGAGLSLEETFDLAARCGAACMTGRGPYQGQLVLR